MEKPKISNVEHNQNLSNIHQLDEAVRQLYSKPENDEELVERVRILKEIPENLNTPKVLVKLGDPTKADKFIYMHDDEGKEYLIALPINKMDYHRQIANFARKLYGKDFKVDGGGYLSVRDGNLVVHGSSGSYGNFPPRVVSILKESFPDINVVDESPSIVEQDKINKEHKAVLESIEDPVQSELYSVVTGDLGTKMGYDSTTLPRPVDNADEMSHMIYRSENGGSFGVDTLFVARRKEDHTLAVNEVAVTRWAIHDVSARAEGDTIIFEFTTNGEKQVLSLPMSEVDKREAYTDLNEPEKIILKMYKDNQAIYNTGTKPKIMHGSAH
ncbi:hypothetical protein IPH92_02965 [Candidatus Kaiserbacteria bacterium]|nr:MAG: hypothetical protein IPH92_02965 [Candidatus Kaiserbacteria bacterium]